MQSKTISQSTMNGYKETEIGIIPNEWDVVPVGALADVNYGKAKPKIKGTVPVVRSGGIYAWASESLVNFPTIVIGRKGNAGQAWFFENPCWPSDTTFYLDWKQDINVHYLYGYLKLNPLSGDHAKTTLPSLQRQDLENFLVPLPPLDEQRRIAAVLITIQQAIAAQEQVIQAARELKRSLMHRLFTYGPYAEERPTKETEIGDIPEYWETQTIGQLCERGNGTVQTGPFGSQLHVSDYVKNGIPSVMPQDIVDNRIVVTNTAQITDEDHKRLARYHLRAGDVVYARRGDIGRRALVTEKEDGWLCGTGSLFIRTGDSGVRPDFLHYFLGLPSVTSWITSRAVGTTMLNLNTKILKSLPVAFPSEEEQLKIASILHVADQKIIVEESREAALKALFKSMLHQLMTGQIRVPEQP